MEVFGSIFRSRSTASGTSRCINYRLSRARRTIENIFRILTSRWQGHKKPIQWKVPRTISIIKTTAQLFEGKRSGHCSSPPVLLSTQPRWPWGCSRPLGGRQLASGGRVIRPPGHASNWCKHIHHRRCLHQAEQQYFYSSQSGREAVGACPTEVQSQTRSGLCSTPHLCQAIW